MSDDTHISASCCSSSTASKSPCEHSASDKSAHAAGNQRSRNVPSFEAWRAHYLFGQELVAGIFILSTLLLFFYNNYQGLCAARPAIGSVDFRNRGNAAIRSDVGSAVSTAPASHNSSSYNMWSQNVWQMMCYNTRYDADSSRQCAADSPTKHSYWPVRMSATLQAAAQACSRSAMHGHGTISSSTSFISNKLNNKLTNKLALRIAAIKCGMIELGVAVAIKAIQAAALIIQV